MARSSPARTPGARDPVAEREQRYPPIGDYALIGDCHSVALVSTAGSIDWCCMPRTDSGSSFGRILDWERGGSYSVTPADAYESTRHYVPGTMVLQTAFRSGGGEATLTDCFTMRQGGRREPYRQLLRVIEGSRGRVDVRVRVAPSFDYGEVRPWIRQLGVRRYAAIGGDDGLLIESDVAVAPTGPHELGV